MQKVTLYQRWIDPSTKQETNVRCVLNAHIWSDDSAAIHARTGQELRGVATIYIPLSESMSGLKYVTPAQWRNAENVDGLWTVDIDLLPIIGRGESDYIFPVGDQYEITQLQNEFAEENGFKQVQSIDVNDYGSTSLQNVVIVCQ